MELLVSEWGAQTLSSGGAQAAQVITAPPILFIMVAGSSDQTGAGATTHREIHAAPPEPLVYSRLSEHWSRWCRCMREQGRYGGDRMHA